MRGVASGWTNRSAGAVLRLVVLCLAFAGGAARGPVPASGPAVPSASERTAVWLLLLYYGEREVERRLEPGPAAADTQFAREAVTEAWLLRSRTRSRAYVVAGAVTAVTGWDVATGAALPEGSLPRPPASLRELVVPGYGPVALGL